jgi:protein-S-isoprenylcysteine O-methyltransferase Ste14
VTHGLYRWSRNPIYALLVAAVAGFGLLLPAWPSLAVLAASAAAVRAQVAREEAYLLATYGDAYRAFCRRTARYAGFRKAPPAPSSPRAAA